MTAVPTSMASLRSNVEYNDKGEASTNTYVDLQRVIHLISQERHLIAYSLFKVTRIRIDVDPNTSQNKQAAEFLLKHKEEFHKLEQHALIFQRAKRNTKTDPNSPWIQCHVHQNVVSSYRRERDGSLSLKVEGDITGLPLFEQVSVMREVDLYSTWAPFVSKSEKLAVLGKLDQVGWFEVSPPLSFGMVRDSCFRAIGCDSMMESGEVIVVAEGLEDEDEDEDEDENDYKGSEQEYLDETLGEMIATMPLNSNFNENITDPNLDPAKGSEEGFVNNFLAREALKDTIEMPPRPKGLNKKRMQLKFFEAIIKVISPTSANTLLVANIDPKLKFIPQFMIDFVMKHMCGILMVKMQSAAKRALINHKSDPLAIRIRDDDFYSNWLLPKFESYSKEMGWELPKVNALEGLADRHSDGQPVAESAYAANNIRTGNQSRSIGGFSHNLATVVTNSPTIISKLSHKFKGRKKKRSRSGENSDVFSVQSAPEVGSPRTKVIFSEKRKARLEELKKYNRKMTTAGPEVFMKTDRNGIVGNILNDYSHLVTVPSLFLFMLIVLHGIPYNGLFSEDIPFYQKAAITAVLSVVFGSFHWVVLESTLVSTFDAIDLPVTKFMKNNMSSETRYLVVDQIHSATKWFSVLLTMMAIVKEIFIYFRGWFLFVLRSVIAVEVVEISPFPSSFNIFSQIIESSAIIMTYSATFAGLCSLIIIANYPAKIEKPAKLAAKSEESESSMPPSPQIKSIAPNNQRTKGVLTTIPETADVYIPEIPKTPMSW